VLAGGSESYFSAVGLKARVFLVLSKLSRYVLVYTYKVFGEINVRQ
jgi:hypothetical protein